MSPRLKTTLASILAVTSVALGVLASRTVRVKAVQVDRSEYNFGRIRSDTQALRHIFIFSNNTGSLVIFDGIVKTCGCTSVELSRSALAPGESMSASCVIDPRGRRGKFRVIVQFVYHRKAGDVQRKEGTICALEAVVDNAIHLSPAYLEFAGASATTQTIRVTADDTRYVATKATSESRPVTARVLPGGLAVEVTFIPALWRNLDRTTRIMISTNYPPEDRISVPIIVR